MKTNLMTSIRNVFLICIIFVSISTLFAQFSGGSGTAADPYQIANPADLNNVRTHIDHNDHFRQTANINLGIAPYNQGGGWEAIGPTLDYPNPVIAFNGTYNGNGFSISNLFINRPATTCQGIFGNTLDADLINVNLVNVNVTGSSHSAGLAGACTNTRIDNCHVTGLVTSIDGIAGGLVGESYQGSQVTSCSSAANIITGMHGGSLIGENYESSISNCFAEGNVTGNMGILGGLVGINSHGTIVYSYAKGNVSSNATDLVSGGLVGMSWGISAIANCYALGNVTGHERSGGLIGDSNLGSITNCYSKGLVSGTSAGGFIGVTSSAISNCYWDTQTSGHFNSAGGEGRTTDQMTFPYAANTYMGWDFNTIWSADTNGDVNGGYPFLHINNSPGMVMPPIFSFSSNTYGSAIDVEITSNTSGAVIHYTNDGSEPTENSLIYSVPIHLYDAITLKAKAYKDGWASSSITTVTYGFTYFAGGNGSLLDPYLIASPIHLNNIRRYMSAHYKLTNTIHLDTAPFNTGEGWTPIGTYIDDQNPNNVPFTGNLDFDYHTIEGLYINRPNTNGQGLFGCVVNGTFNNVYLSDAQVTGWDHVGTLAGYIENSQVSQVLAQTNEVNGHSNVGGLFGTAKSLDMQNTQVHGTVTGTQNVGGLIGCSRDFVSVSNCVTTGSTEGSSDYIGGMIGLNSGDLMISFSSSTSLTEGNHHVGGLVGGSQVSVYVADSHYVGTITGNANHIGGIIGANTGLSIIERSYTRGSVSGHSFTGGIIGANSATDQVKDCYSKSNVTGINSVGGIAGLNDGALIQDSYSIGAVIGNMLVGGLVGSNQNNGTVLHSYWNTQTSGQSTSAGGEGRTTAQMTSPLMEDTYIDWNFETVWVADIDDTVNNGYPYLNDPAIPVIVVNPVFSQPSGIYLTAFQLVLGCPTSGSVVYYTLDGTEPTEASHLYSSPITIDYSVTIKARAYRLGSTPSSMVFATYGINNFTDGDGSMETPYLVSTASQLNSLRIAPSANFKLIADIDLNVPPFNQGGGWNPIGADNDNTPQEHFYGKLDGNGFTISNLYIHRPNANYQGLFGYIENGTFSNLNLVNVNVRGGLYVGGLVGNAERISLSNCNVAGTVSGQWNNVGGLIGAVSSWPGNEYQSTITNCHTSCTVSGEGSIGGLTGYNNVPLTITNCSANGNVTGSGWRTGGLAGCIYATSSINNSYSTGSVSGTTYVGGLLGEDRLGEISNSYSLSSVTGSDKVGGLVGGILGVSIINCYSTGAVTGSTNTGGLIGFLEFNNNTIINSYWNITTAGIETSVAGAGRNTDDMTYPYATNTYVNWNFEGTWFADVTSTMNSGYPYLTGTSVPNEDNVVTHQACLQNYPNPFNPETTISFTVNKASKANLSIYNIKGQLVKTLINDKLNVGTHSYSWNGTNESGTRVSSGIYFSRLVNEGKVQNRKMLLLK